MKEENSLTKYETITFTRRTPFYGIHAVGFPLVTFKKIVFLKSIVNNQVYIRLIFPRMIC
jgi:hypothetical protein